MKAAIITTVDHNVGDDFVREGIKYLVREYYKNKKEVEFSNVHKHSPITSRYGFELFRLNRYRFSNIFDYIIPKFFTSDRILEADLVIQSGAPVYWCHTDENIHCYSNEWYGPLIKHRALKNKKAKLINLAAGTCQKYHSEGIEFCPRCEKYMKDFYKQCSSTTVRDQLSQVAFKKMNIDVPVIPCSSIFARLEHGLEDEGEEYIAMNYMRGGAHYTFGQDIDINRWEEVFKATYFEIKKNEKVVLVCHNQKEVDSAKRIDQEAQIFYEKDDYVAYMNFYSKAKLGILNRVHAGFMLASFGKPSIVIGNDSRARMANEVGVKSFYVNDVTKEKLFTEYKRMSNEGELFSNNFDEIKKKAYLDYMDAFKKMDS